MIIWFKYSQSNCEYLYFAGVYLNKHIDTPRYIQDIDTQIQTHREGETQTHIQRQYTFYIR